ncbi:hypothetical protein Cfor_07569, partial [Coptotermes formosanus]
AFKTQRGLPQHERLVHPVVRNEKREKAATERPVRGLAKGFGKIWRKEEIETMMRPKKSLHEHPQIAKQMMAHIPGKTAKQIRDKRKEPSYKSLVQAYNSTQGASSGKHSDPIVIATSSSESASDAPQQVATLYIPETDDGDITDREENSRQQSRPSPTSDERALGRGDPAGPEHPPVPAPRTGRGLSPGRGAATGCVLRAAGSPSPERPIQGSMPEQHTDCIITVSSGSENEAGTPQVARLYSPETGVGEQTDGEEDPRQPTSSSPAAGERASGREDMTGREHLLGQVSPAVTGREWAQSRPGALTGRETQRSETPNSMSPADTESTQGLKGDEAPQIEGAEAETHDNTKKWRTETIRQALAESRDISTLSNRYRDLHSKMISSLAAMSENEDLLTQTLIDDIYAEVIAHIEPKRSTRANKRKRTRGPKTQAGCKRKEEPEITIPFAVSESDQRALDRGNVLQTITPRDITERINRMRKSTAPGPDGIERKHISSLDMREIMRILFNIILVSKTQPKAWNANRTILIPNEGKDPSRVQNYRPLTISSLICRTYWGIVDKKLREVISFSRRQKGFVHETGCFNNGHILNETIKAAKGRDSLVAVQLDITKAFDTVPHKAIEAALCRLGLPQYGRVNTEDASRA